MEVTHPDVQKLADLVTKFCKEWFNDADYKKLLVVVGPTGCGKTHISRRAAGWASAVSYERWLRVGRGDALPETMFWDWCKIGNPQRYDEQRFCEWLKEVTDVSMLVLDDIGTELDQFKSGAPIARLCEVLNVRAGKFTMITTNVPPSGWAARWDARVEDRLLRRSVVIEMAAPSYTLSDI